MQDTDKKRKKCEWCGRHRYETFFFLSRGRPRPECKDCTLDARARNAAWKNPPRKGA